MTRRRVGRAVVTLLLISLASGACGADDGAAGNPDPDVSVTDAWARPARSEGNAAIYATIVNGEDELLTLVSVVGEMCGDTQLHMSETDEDGVARMTPLPDGIAVPPGASVILGPGGLHVMCLDLQRDLALGDRADLSFEFEDGRAIPVQAIVRDEPGT